jgi:hypothetical protein
MQFMTPAISFQFMTSSECRHPSDSRPAQARQGTNAGLHRYVRIIEHVHASTVYVEHGCQQVSMGKDVCACVRVGVSVGVSVGVGVGVGVSVGVRVGMGRRVWVWG